MKFIDVVTIKSTESITFSNPGDIRIGLKTALSGGVSDPRNETIMKMFGLIDIGERAGSGIPDFINTWSKYVKMTPIYEVTQNSERTKLTVPYTLTALQQAGELITDKSGLKDGLTTDNNVGDNTQNVGDNTQNVGDNTQNVGDNTQNVGDNNEITSNERQNRIMSLILVKPNISANEMSDLLNVTKRTIERDIAKMHELGFITREGSAKAGKWVILKSPL